MSMQYAQPLICDARNLTSSISPSSKPDFLTYSSKSHSGRTAFGEA
jgi:hypothetical protein